MSKAEEQPIPLPDVTTAVRLSVRLSDGLLLDDSYPVSAGLVRKRDLESQIKKLIDAPAVLVDLSEVKSLGVNSAFELLGMWIPNLQREREKAGKDKIPVIVTAKYLDILRTVHAALRDSVDSWAWALLPRDAEGNEKLVQIGRLRPTLTTTST